MGHQLPLTPCPPPQLSIHCHQRYCLQQNWYRHQPPQQRLQKTCSPTDYALQPSSAGASSAVAAGIGDMADCDQARCAWTAKRRGRPPMRVGLRPRAPSSLKHCSRSGHGMSSSMACSPNQEGLGEVFFCHYRDLSKYICGCGLRARIYLLL